MEFNSLSFLPIEGLGSTNLIVGNHSSIVKYCYLSFSADLPIKSYFKIVVPKDIILRSISYGKQTIFKGKEDFITPFLNSVPDENVIVCIPIINTKKEKLENKNLFIGSDAIIESFKIFGSIYTLGGYGENSLDAELWKHVYKEFCDISEYPVAIVLDETQVETPCAICKLNKDKIGDVCMYRTNTYDCVFNCAVEDKDAASATLPKTSSLFAINYFEEVTGNSQTLVKQVEAAFAVEDENEGEKACSQN